MFNIGCWIHKHKSLWKHPCNLLWSFHFILVPIVNLVLQYIELKVYFTLSLDYFIDFFKHLIANCHISSGHKEQATLNV